ncbi:restriction endonuclease subunit S [Dichelobacter nodosus]|uniref:restriction endonuclease subunit S n=1 Tax=Dichelobacter nodosus TaxID=870 RepID=UPI00107E78BC|nr:restriction endonuclease subunit S [Dichelobacter nodosus]TGA65982.1 restriction endonuclease subunit S [Dichelobacter nodosus]
MELKPGYKMTEVGVIPEDWDCLRACEFGFFKGGSGFPLWAQGQRTGEYPFFKVSDMNNEGNETFMTATNHYVSEQTRKHLGAQVFPADSIVFAKVGAAVFLERKKILGQPSCIDNNMAAYVLDASRADVRFVHSMLLMKKLGALVATTALPALNGKQLGEMVLALPPLPEQRAIAQALSEVDALLAALDKIIAKKRDLKQATMQQLLTGKTRLPGFSGEWEAKPFSAVLNRLNAKSHQIQASEYQEAGKFPVVDQGKDFVVGFSDREDKRYRCPDGGVIVFGDHTCIVKFIDFDFLVGADGTQILHGKHGQNTRFHALQLQYRGIETTGYNRHFKILKEREFFVPPLPEQDAIASALSSMDAELAALESRREKTRNIKQAMMQELLTGKTRLV